MAIGWTESSSATRLTPNASAATAPIPSTKGHHRMGLSPGYRSRSQLNTVPQRGQLHAALRTVWLQFGHLSSATTTCSAEG
jgi:hypothetical protein